jgi:hypothetical protein
MSFGHWQFIPHDVLLIDLGIPLLFGAFVSMDVRNSEWRGIRPQKWPCRLALSPCASGTLDHFFVGWTHTGYGYFFQAMFSILWSIYVNYERDKHAMFLGLFAGRLPGVVYIIPDLVEGSWRENKSSDLWFLVTPVSMCFHDYPLVI